MSSLQEYLLFLAEIVTSVVAIFIVFAGILSLLAKEKSEFRQKIIVKKINDKYLEMMKALKKKIKNKKDYKKFVKSLKPSTEKSKRNIFIVHFKGDIRASEVENLREEITAILTVSTPEDEVVVILESPGGMVHAYGLAASELARIKQRKIPMTICVDKVAASGGYLMACVADKILAAPFAYIGSIGVLAQLPNFNRLLKEKNIDYEQITSGEYKRTLTMFGVNTEAGRQKLQEEINDMHTSFKNHILQFRPSVNIEEVATGEYWLASRALELNLIDELLTSDDYLLNLSNTANLFEVRCEVPKTWSEKFLTQIRAWVHKEILS